MSSDLARAQVPPLDLSVIVESPERSPQTDGIIAGPPPFQIGKVGTKHNCRQDPIKFVYVPSHLYHILFELFKNAMRATIEHAGEDALTLPPVEGKFATERFKSVSFGSKSCENQHVCVAANQMLHFCNERHFGEISLSNTNL